MDYSESELTNILTNIANRVAAKFKFGYHQLEDMKQQAYVFALEALPRFDLSKAKVDDKLSALEAFLYTHVHNRLCSFKRDNYMRPEPPCDSCGIKDCIKEECVALRKFYARNEKKQNIMRPIPLESVNSEGEDNMSNLLDFGEDIDIEEIKLLINKELDPSLRQDYIRFIYGLKLTKPKREALVETIKEIILNNFTGEKNDDKKTN